MTENFMTENPAVFIEPLLSIARQAGQAILSYYMSSKAVKVTLKPDETPVTEADMIAHKIIRQSLTALTPDIPVLSEEAADIPFETRSQWQCYWLVDPLDGTKEFICRTDEFTVNIALIDHHASIFGMIYAPMLDVYYYAAKGMDAFKRVANQEAQTIHVRKITGDKLFVTASRRHGKIKLEKFITQLTNYDLIIKGSSLKSCLVAEGAVDIYPCLGKTSEWDIAAAQCIVEQAGGQVVDTHFKPFCYNTKASVLNPQLLIIGDSEYDWGRYFS